MTFFAQHGVLPYAGGLYDQPDTFVEEFLIFSDARTTHAAEESKKR